MRTVVASAGSKETDARRDMLASTTGAVMAIAGTDDGGGSAGSVADTAASKMNDD